MVKLSALPLLFIGLPFLAGEQTNYRNYLNVADNERGNNTLMSVSYTSSDEFRLYHYDDLVIDEVDDEAFNNTKFKTLVLTKDVKYINDAAFTNAPNIEYLRFTGSEADYNNLNLNVNFKEISLTILARMALTRPVFNRYLIVSTVNSERTFHLNSSINSAISFKDLPSLASS